MLAAVSISIRSLVLLGVGAIILWRLTVSPAPRRALSTLLLFAVICAVMGAFLLAGARGPTITSSQQPVVTSPRVSVAVTSGKANANADAVRAEGWNDDRRVDDHGWDEHDSDVQALEDRELRSLAIARNGSDSTGNSDSLDAELGGPASGSVVINSTNSGLTIDTSRLESRINRISNRAERRLDRVRTRLDHLGHSRVGEVVLSAIALAALLYLGYLLLDASTRGQFSWTLRIVSIITFGVIIAAVHALQ